MIVRIPAIVVAIRLKCQVNAAYERDAAIHDSALLMERLHQMGNFDATIVEQAIYADLREQSLLFRWIIRDMHTEIRRIPEQHPHLDSMLHSKTKNVAYLQAVGIPQGDGVFGKSVLAQSFDQFILLRAAILPDMRIFAAHHLQVSADIPACQQDRLPGAEERASHRQHRRASVYQRARLHS